MNTSLQSCCMHCHPQSSTSKASTSTPEVLYTSTWQALCQERDLVRTCIRMTKDAASISADIFFVCAVPFFLNSGSPGGTVTAVQECRMGLESGLGMMSCADATLDHPRQLDIVRCGFVAISELRKHNKNRVASSTQEGSATTTSATTTDTTDHSVGSRRPSTSSSTSTDSYCTAEEESGDEDIFYSDCEGKDEEEISPHSTVSIPTTETSPTPPLSTDSQYIAATEKSNHHQFAAQQILLILKGFVALLRLFRFLLCLITFIIKLLKVLLQLFLPQ